MTVLRGLGLKRRGNKARNPRLVQNLTLTVHYYATIRIEEWDRGEAEPVSARGLGTAMHPDAKACYYRQCSDDNHGNAGRQVFLGTLSTRSHFF